MAEAHEAIERFTELYVTARKQYPALPDLPALEAEWDILEVVGRERHFPRNAVRYLRWFMMRAINGWAGYLHEFILPNQQSAVSMEEYSYFDEREKQEIIGILNWIMYRNRLTSRLQLDEDDDKTAALIAEVWAEWQERKPYLRTVLDKNAAVWRQKMAAPTRKPL